jgi:hypothetical protein
LQYALTACGQNHFARLGLTWNCPFQVFDVDDWSMIKEVESHILSKSELVIGHEGGEFTLVSTAVGLSQPLYQYASSSIRLMVFRALFPWLQVLLERSVTGQDLLFVFQFAFTRRNAVASLGNFGLLGAVCTFLHWNFASSMTPPPPPTPHVSLEASVNLPVATHPICLRFAGVSLSPPALIICKERIWP